MLSHPASLYMNHDRTSSWDFSRVLELVNSLSSTPFSVKSKEHGPTQSLTELSEKDHEASSAGLGDFSRVWEYLGAPKDAPAPVVPPGDAHAFNELPGKEDYASDGAIYRHATKEVKWKDQTDDQDVSQTLEESDGTKSPTTVRRERNRRKKQKRKERAEAGRLDKARATSEPDSDIERKATQGAPAKKASVHTLKASQTTETGHRYNLRPRTPNGKVFRTPDASDRALNPTAPVFQSQSLHTPRTPPVVGSGYFTSDLALNHNNNTHPEHNNSVEQNEDGHANGNLSAAEQLNKRLQQVWTSPSHSSYVNFDSLTSVYPTTPNPPALPLIPSSVQPVPSSVPTIPPRRRTIQPLSLRTGEDRYWALMLKLISDFPADLRTLVAPSLLINHNSNPGGIHVFVDASNIFIGFHDQLKRARGIPLSARVPRVDLSFASLALLLERRRPVAKRVLAGSTPVVPAIEEAHRIGYELNVLDKVHKAKEAPNNTTPRHHKSLGPPVAIANTTSTDSDPTPPLPAKWVEQGVDEILHLKMLESVVDYMGASPSTIVLATGDAAEAEYSPGFMRMVERALERGWAVELVSWSHAISGQYCRRAWVERWGGRFRVIELDGYAEELLEM